MPIQIITDSGSDLPTDLIAAHSIKIVHLPVSFQDELMPDETDAASFYARMRECPELPRTASPSPNTFLEAYKDVEAGRDILVVSMSSNISSTYQSALIAKGLYEDEGLPNRIEIIDSKTFSGGLSLVVSQAAEWARAGSSLDELKDKVSRLALETSAFFTLDSLENVIKGGRLSRLAGGVASVLNIKLLLKINEDGVVEVEEKTRGFRKALNSLLARLDDKQHDYENGFVAIVHSNCEKLALEFKDRVLEKHPFKKVLFSSMGPVMGTYAGEGGIGVAF
ncbi:DegV family protein [Paenibacillus sp. D51F]